MAITETRQYREPFVEAAGLGVTNEGLKLLGTSLPTSTYTGRQFVQGQSGLEQQAATAAAGLDSLVGPQAYQQFQSPYQQEVIDTSLAAMQREQAGGLNALRAQAASAGAFGGSRMGAAEGVFQADAATQRALLEAQLRQQGFQQSLVGPQLASVIGGFPAATQVQSTPPPSTTQQLLGLGIGATGLLGAAKGMFS